MSLSARGTRLIRDADGGTVTAKDMMKKYGWVVVKDLYSSTSALNVNALETQVHRLMSADPRSIWLQNGKGGVKLIKDEDGNINVLKLSLNIIHGARKNLTFAAAERHAIEHNGDDDSDDESYCELDDAKPAAKKSGPSSTSAVAVTVKKGKGRKRSHSDSDDESYSPDY